MEISETTLQNNDSTVWNVQFSKSGNIIKRGNKHIVKQYGGQYANVVSESLRESIDFDEYSSDDDSVFKLSNDLKREIWIRDNIENIYKKVNEFNAYICQNSKSQFTGQGEDYGHNMILVINRDARFGNRYLEIWRYTPYDVEQSLEFLMTYKNLKMQMGINYNPREWTYSKDDYIRIDKLRHMPINRYKRKYPHITLKVTKMSCDMFFDSLEYVDEAISCYKDIMKNYDL